jgi:subtilisin family serine protease
VEFDVFIPANFVLPNLLVVGAVDQAGRRTDFTSMGQNVIVYSNGFEVDSSVPGGARMQMSGTSMASPNVTNLAAKLLALKSDLEPAAVIELIKKGSDRLEDQQDLLLINPKATVALLGNP